MGMPSRLAVQDEDLVVHRFASGSLGLGPLPDRTLGPWAGLKRFLFPAPPPRLVACVPPGALLQVRDIPFSLQVEFGVGSREDVFFTRVLRPVDGYRDSLMFGNGNQVLFQRLEPGQRVRILDLPAQEERHTATQEPAWLFSQPESLDSTDEFSRCPTHTRS